jgi:hypothetical protein
MWKAVKIGQQRILSPLKLFIMELESNMFRLSSGQEVDEWFISLTVRLSSPTPDHAYQQVVIKIFDRKEQECCYFVFGVHRQSGIPSRSRTNQKMPPNIILLFLYSLSISLK